MRAPGRDPWTPPRLLLGAALLYWGAVTGHPVIGLVCAFMVEGRAWIEWRWNFGGRGFVRAWSLSILVSVLAAAALWLGGEQIVMLFTLMTWLPLFFLPIMLAQQYATEPSMPINTFSFIARRMMKLDRDAGRVVEPVRIHFGYIYFCVVLFASALRGVSDQVFFIGLIVLSGLGLFFSSPLGRLRPLSWSVALVLSMGMALSMAAGLVTLWQALGGLYQVQSGLESSGDQIRTAIGQLGRIKQSYRIMWRIDEDEAGGLRLFREGAYNRYGQGHWTHRPMEGTRPKDDYDDMDESGEEGEERQLAFRREEFELDPESRRKLTIRGGVTTVVRLPLPDSTQRLVRPQVAGIEYNSLGTVRIWNPEHSVVDLDVYYGGASYYEKPPDLEWDLQIPDGEKDGLERVCGNWELYDLPDREAVERIKVRFLREFEYTLHLGYGSDTGPGYSEAVTKFLEGGVDENGFPYGKRGHCEYFATASVLLFRELGIPARYCVGYSAQEQDQGSGEWILRGRHAHAWCRVYLDGGPTVQIVKDPETGEPVLDPITGETTERIIWTGGRWVDFDPTPPSWFAIEGSVIPWERRLLDWWQTTREDVLLWRTSSGNSSAVNWVMATIGALLVTYVAWRLARSRTRHRGTGRPSAAGSGKPAVVTPLHGLASTAEHWLGPRPASQTFPGWILRMDDLVPGIGSNLHRAVGYYWKARFDPIGLDPSEESEFEILCADLKSHLRELRRSEG